MAVSVPPSALNQSGTCRYEGFGKETIFLKAIKEVIQDQIECGIDIVTDGEVRRENYIHYHCRHIQGIDFNKLTL